MASADERVATTHTLHPGDVVCAGRGERLETLLGSCVAIILTDPRRTLGAMCHIVHSSRALDPLREDGTYAQAALVTMSRLLRERGIEPSLCEGYVYGGGNMFPATFTQPHVGDRNAQWALDWLHGSGVQVLHHDIGGNAYRRLRWTVGPIPPQVTAVQV